MLLDTCALLWLAQDPARFSPVARERIGTAPLIHVSAFEVGIISGFGVPVMFDGTHSVQQPSSAGGRTGGDRRFVPTLVRAAVAAGCHGLFLEVHERPETAPSDRDNMLPLEQLPPLLRQVTRLRAALAPHPV